MKEAFTYMFKDNKFWIKGLSYLGLVFIANLITNYGQTFYPACPRCAVSIPWQYWTFIAIGSIINLIPLGYMYTCIKSLIDQDENPILPFVSPWENLIKGFKYSIAILLLLVPLFIVTILIIAGIASISMGSALGMIISKTIMLTAIIGFAVLLLGFNWIFANKDSFLSFYRFKEVFAIIKSEPKLYFAHLLMIGFVFIVNMLLELGFGFTAGWFHIPTIIGLFVVGLLAAFTGTYAIFVICHLIAKAVKKDFVSEV